MRPPIKNLDQRGAIWPLETETAAKLVVILPRGMGMAMPRRPPVAGVHDY
jgi:hypothetical protein